MRIVRKCSHCLVFQHLPSSSALLHRSKAEIDTLAAKFPQKNTVQVRNLSVFYVFQKIINKTQEIHFFRMDQSDSRSQISYSPINNPIKHRHFLMEKKERASIVLIGQKRENIWTIKVLEDLINQIEQCHWLENGNEKYKLFLNHSRKKIQNDKWTVDFNLTKDCILSKGYSILSLT